jgi:hypothetical protein
MDLTVVYVKILKKSLRCFSLLQTKLTLFPFCILYHFFSNIQDLLLFIFKIEKYVYYRALPSAGGDILETWNGLKDHDLLYINITLLT